MTMVMMPTGKLGKTYTIKDLSQKFSVTARTLRHYEDQGLLSPTRIGQSRVYSQSDMEKVAWILRGKRVGFSLSEIAEMLQLYTLSHDMKQHAALTAAKCYERIIDLEAQRDDINATIDELHEFCSLLDHLTTDEKTGQAIDSRTGNPPEIKQKLFATFNT